MSAALRRLLGLFHPDHALRLGPGPGPTRRARGEQGVILAEERRRGRVEGGAPVQEAVRCDYDDAELIGPMLVGRAALLSLRGARIERAQAAAGAHISASVLHGATLIAPELAALRWSGCGLHEAQIEGGALGRLALCDLMGARLSGARVTEAVACDLTRARITRCDLSGADLRGSVFHRARFTEVQLDGAQVAGADFTGATGLTAAQREALIAGGARFRGASLVAPLRWVLPGASNVRLQRLATGAWWALVLGGGGLALGASALALTPPAPPTAPPPPPPMARELTQEEVRAAQLALRSLRDALSRAHQEMTQRGAVHRAWPDLYEVQENRYDADGDGPAEVYLELVPGGLPDNVLTDSRGGVLPYCNEEPTQETISGVDTDWHYCEQTGRVFASAGFTGQATLNW